MDATASDVHVASTEWKKPNKAMTLKQVMELQTELVGKGDDAGKTVVKVNVDKRLVYGWASIIEVNGQAVVDLQGDVIDEETLVTAAQKFVSDARKAKVMHGGDVVGEIVESLVFTNELQAVLGISLGMVGWFICMKIADDAVWQRVKDGELKAFSIGGTGERMEI